MPWPRPWGQAEYFFTGEIPGQLPAFNRLTLRDPVYGGCFTHYFNPGIESWQSS
jgi:hypothetical protein